MNGEIVHSLIITAAIRYKTFLSSQKLSLCPLKSAPSSKPWPKATSGPFVANSFALSRISCKWNPRICSRFTWLLSIRIKFLRFLHVCVYQQFAPVLVLSVDHCPASQKGK